MSRRNLRNYQMPDSMPQQGRMNQRYSENTIPPNYENARPGEYYADASGMLYTMPKGGYGAKQPGPYDRSHPSMSTNPEVAARGSFTDPIWEQRAQQFNAANTPPASGRVVDLGSNGGGVYQADANYMMPGGALVHQPRPQYSSAADYGLPSSSGLNGMEMLAYGGAGLGAGALASALFRGGSQDDQRMEALAASLSDEDREELNMLLSNAGM